MFAPPYRIAIAGLLALLATACVPSSDEAQPTDAGADAVDAPFEGPTVWRVRVSPQAPEAVRLTAQHVTGYLEEMGGEVDYEPTTAMPDCDSEVGAVVFAGDGLGDGVSEASLETEAPTDQTWRIAETRCDGGVRVVLAGGGLLGRQYAGYEWLHRMGVRFFHPESEFVPDAPDFPEHALWLEHTPAFEWRSVSLHLTHPLELGDIFREHDAQYADEARRYIDWQIKNGASFGHSGVPVADLEGYGLMRGFPRSASIRLHNQQQGFDPVIDPDDPRPVNDQIAEAIEEQMAGEPTPEIFSFSFNPSEFTEISDLEVVDQMSFIAEYMAEHYPDTLLQTTNHGTHGEPTENYGVRFYDLPQFAPPNLGVKVHTLMFYDLFRPAPVYGNEDFGFAYDFMVQEYQTRELWYYPEAAWWLTFDIAVPLYLPITVEARSRDIDGIAFMLDGKLNGHRVFGSGHEWGYWQNEYCSFRMAADLGYDWRDCFADITYVTGDPADEVAAVLERAVEIQERDIIYGDVLAYIVGTDPETELAASVGVVFHPLPPTPRQILGWEIDRVTDFKVRIAPSLERMERDHMALVERLEAVRDTVDPDGLAWFDEIVDGLEANALRARHGRQVYGALVAKRESQLRFDDALAEQAETMLADAKQTTQDALAVIHRREQGYRYAPVERAIGGGPEGTEDDNWTIYPYRYLNRTHRGYYYTRIDQLAEEALSGTGDVVAVPDAILADGQELSVTVTDASLTGVAVDFGDGEQASGSSVTHTYGAHDAYEVVVSADAGFEQSFSVASVATEQTTGFSGKLAEPNGVQIIEPVLPSATFGRIDDTRLALGFGTDESGDVPYALWRVLEINETATALETRPTQLVIPVVDRSSGSVRTSLLVEGGRWQVSADAATAALIGELSTEAVIAAVVSIGGFEEEGARRVVAQTLGYTPETLPERVPFRLEYTLAAE